jgi:acetyl esterase/lipase
MPEKCLVGWIAIAVALAATRCAAQEHYEPQQKVTLWPESPPLAEGPPSEAEVTEDARIGRRVNRVTRPELWVYRAEQPNPAGTAVVICPGGGYNILALDLEGTEIARWFNSIGVHAFVLHYRVPRSKEHPHHLAPLHDAQRAIRTVRHHAAPWGIDPEHIGILGFSAGGNLAALASAAAQIPPAAEQDEVSRASGRPDFTVLVYPAYLSDSDDRPELAPLFQVTGETPPAIMIHTGDDPISVTGSLAYYLALRNHKVPAALRVYPRGGHGYGLRPSEHDVSHWPGQVAQWMRSEGLLEVADHSPQEAAHSDVAP